MDIEKRTTIKIDPVIKKQMKIQAVKDDLSLYEAVEQAIDDWLAKRHQEVNDEKI